MPEKTNVKVVARGARLPAFYFGAALAASVISVFFTISHSRTISEAAWKLHDRHYRLLETATRLVLLNSKLTMAANLGAVTGDAVYSREHESLAAELDSDIKKLNTYTADPDGSIYTARINEANLRLMELDRGALLLGRSGERRKASVLLGGREYQELEKSYAAGVDGLLEEFEASLRKEGIFSRRVIFRKSLLSALSVSVTLLLFVLAVVSARRWLKARSSTDAMVAEKEAEFRHFFDTVQEVFYRADLKGRLSDITPSIQKYAGYTREELLGRPISNLYLDPEDRKPLIKELLAKGMVEDYEVKLKAKGGRALDVLVNARLLKGFGGLPAGVEGSLRDITVRKATEDRLRRINRLYSILSLVNEAIVRVRTPHKLYEEICRIAVENGGMKFAWVGLPGPDGQVLPVASAGDDGGYLKETIISPGASAPEGRGTGAEAFREGKVLIDSDMKKDPAMLPWRHAALQRGFRSSAAFPIGGGTITFYAAEPGFFMKDEEQLLYTLAEDVTYAVNSMAKGTAAGEDPRRP